MPAALVAALALTACGGNKSDAPAVDGPDSVAAATTDSTSTDPVVAEQAKEAAAQATGHLDEVLAGGKKADPTAVKEAVKAIEAKVKELQKAGDTEAAATYAKEVKDYLSSHADQLKAAGTQTVTLEKAINAAVNLPGNAKEAAQKVVNAAKSGAAAAEETGANAVTQTKEAAKAKANETVNKAKSDANAAVDKAKADTKKKADEAVQKGAEKAAGAIGKALGL